MQPAFAQLNLRTLRRGGLQQTRKPGKRRGDGAAIGKTDPRLSSSKRTALGEVFIPAPCNEFLVGG